MSSTFMRLTLASARRKRDPGCRSVDVGQDGGMEMTGWLSGQVFVQTVDETEVASVRAFLDARGLTYQVLTLNERMQLDAGDPGSVVSTDRFSVAVQVAGFPQVVAPVLSDLVQRAHGGGWDPTRGPGS
jgi:hypothetical protein